MGVVAPGQMSVVSSFSQGARSSAVDQMTVELEQRTGGGREQLDLLALAQAENTQGEDTIILQANVMVARPYW